MDSRNNVQKKIAEAGRFDVVVIGGGASGIGTAVEATLRGYKTLLLEKHDFTKGTSSKSTKLIHGGVRYLAQGDLKMVREALKERGYLVKNAPHLVHRQPFVIPVYRWWDAALYTIGLTFYDLLAGKFSLGRSVFFSKKKTLEALKGISTKGLKGGIRYFDGQFDDSRLAIDLLHVLYKHGGLALNYADVIGLVKDEQGITTGVEYRSVKDGESATVSADLVVNAAGVWVDDIMEMDNPGHEKTIRPSQGIHLVLDKSFLPGNHALMIPKTSDGRVLFAVPWHDHLVVGTTDTPIDKATAEPVALEKEINFILNTAKKYLNKPVERKDVLSVFAGLRPLAAPKEKDSKTKEISRNHKIIVSDSNLVTVIGGKWTTYRKMAEDIINTAIRKKIIPSSLSNTRTFKISDAPELLKHAGESLNVESSKGQSFFQYGNNRQQLLDMIDKEPGLAERVHPKLPYTFAEVRWCTENEMVEHLEDLLSRRLRAMLLNTAATEVMAEKILPMVAETLSWDEERSKKELNEIKMLAKNYKL